MKFSLRSLLISFLQRRRENEASKLRVELEKKLHRFEGYIDRLERRAGSQFRPTEDGEYTA